MTLPSLLAFTAAAALLTVTPGPRYRPCPEDRGGGGAARRALLAGLGIALGCLGWGAIVAVGFGAPLAGNGSPRSMPGWGSPGSGC